MKALLVNPVAQSVQQVEINNRDEIKAKVGFDTIISDEVGPEDDCLFFDEDCFLRGTEGRFQIGSLVPVAGIGVVMGSPDGGVTLSDVNASVESLMARLKYL
jgi:hypothetical protein|tara:strand:+ start:1560 stop:1865 length:306 start_codon:yes stop_codon:yes gene_type:complete